MGSMAKRKKRTIKNLHKVAEKRGGRCLSQEYVGTREKYAWECEHGHKWRATAASLLHKKTWCPTCYKLMRQHTIQDLHNIAAERGGKCLSLGYENIKKKYMWECEHGHKWEAPLGYIIHQQTWCPTCNKLKWKRIPNELCRYDTTEKGIDEPCHRCSLSLPREHRNEVCPLLQASKSLEAIVEAETNEQATEIAQQALKKIRPGDL